MTVVLWLVMLASGIGAVGLTGEGLLTDDRPAGWRARRLTCAVLAALLCALAVWAVTP